MTDYKPGDIVLVPYPFGERAGGKKRPVLIVSSAELNQSTGEIVIAQITSRTSTAVRPGDYKVHDWKQANLPRPSVVRSRLATMQSSLILRRLGELTDTDLESVTSALRGAILTQ